MNDKLAQAMRSGIIVRDDRNQRVHLHIEDIFKVAEALRSELEAPRTTEQLWDEAQALPARVFRVPRCKAVREHHRTVHRKVATKRS